MSSAAEIAPTLEYLTDAAHLLQTTAPETSAHVMRQRGELMWQRDTSLSDIQRQHVCGACGNIMIPGNTSALKLDARRARYTTKKSKTNLRKPEERERERGVKDLTKVTQCNRCDRKTKTKIDPFRRSKAVNKSIPRAATHQAEPSTAAPPPKPSSANAQSNVSSKKRAKNRKAGLQALLSGQQQQKSKSLSLADFMQK